MARARTRKKKKRARKAKAPARRRRAPKVKPRTGPVQLWLPLQMPLGLSGGVAVVPVGYPAADEADAGAAALVVSVGEQSSLFE